MSHLRRSLFFFFFLFFRFPKVLMLQGRKKKKSQYLLYDMTRNDNEICEAMKVIADMAVR